MAEIVSSPLKSKKLSAAQIAHMREKDSKMVKGIFKFLECPGGETAFYFKQYKGDSLCKYTLRDNQICSIPLGLAKHIKKTCRVPRYEHALDESGRIDARLAEGGYRIKSYRRRMDFESLDFIEDEELINAEATNIISVVHV